jgi:nucleoid DNA-binding protein
MANLIEAMRQLGPKLKLNRTLPEEDLADWIAMRTSLKPSEVSMMIQELRTGILYFNQRGTPVKLTGLGKFSPSIRRDGKVRINLRLDHTLRKKIFRLENFKGEVENRSAVGLDNDDLKAQWDADHPDDPLEF